MSDHELSHETREALGNLKTYLAGGNEAVQYAFSFLADLVTQTPAVMIGGIPAGSLPASEIVTDPNGSVTAVDPSVTGTFPGSITLNLRTGEFSATWAAIKPPPPSPASSDAWKTSTHRPATDSCSSSPRTTQVFTYSRPRTSEATLAGGWERP